MPVNSETTQGTDIAGTLSQNTGNQIMRDKIARRVMIHHLQLLHDFGVDGDIYRKDPEFRDAAYAEADAAIAALPDMVVPLVWEHTIMTWGDRQPDHTYIEKPSAQYWEANGVKHRYEITEVLDERAPRSHGIFYLCIGGGSKQVGFPDLEEAQDKANSHNCRIALSAFGITPPDTRDDA